jgi:hypothetical protein
LAFAIFEGFFSIYSRAKKQLKKQLLAGQKKQLLAGLKGATAKVVFLVVFVFLF